MKTIKTPKGMHNRPYHGSWCFYDKEERKRRRKLFKAVRHKLLFHIPLTEEEIEFQNENGITENSKMTFEGEIKYDWEMSKKQRYLVIKEFEEKLKTIERDENGLITPEKWNKFIITK